MTAAARGALLATVAALAGTCWPVPAARAAQAAQAVKGSAPADRRLRVRLLVDPATTGESAPALVRAELEASGFAVELRRAGLSGAAARAPSARGQRDLFAEVGFGRADGRASAEVHFLARDGARAGVHRVDVGPVPARSEGRRTRVLVTLAVRVGELLRAHAARDAAPVAAPAPAPGPAPARPSLVDELLAAPPPPPPAPLTAPPPERVAAPVAAPPPAAPVTTPAPAVAPPPSPPPPPTAEPAPARAPVALDDRPAGVAAAAASAASEPRVPGFQLDAGVAAGRSVAEVGVAFGPVVRGSLLRSSGLLARVTVATLLAGAPLTGPTGQARLYQTVGLAQLGYQGNFWRGRVAPEATIGLGAQHVLASGRGTPGSATAGTTSESVLAVAVAAGAGATLKLSPAMALVLGADLYRAIPRPLVLAPPVDAAQGGELVIGRGAPLSFMVTTALKLAL